MEVIAHTRGKKCWSDEREQLVKQLFLNGIIDPNNIHKSQVAWITEDPNYPLLHLFKPSKILKIKAKELKYFLPLIALGLE